MPWYWILIILSAVVGPFEAFYTINKAWKKAKARREQETREKEAGEEK